MIQALIFDMDGLLVDTEPLAAKSMDDFLARYGLQRRPEVHKLLLGRRLNEAIAIVKDAYALSTPLDQLVEEYSELRVAALRGNVRLMPGAREIIDEGRSLGLSLALATSGIREHASLSLAEAGLTGLFDSEVTGDEVSRGKPAPDLFLQAARLLDIDPELCIVFEDAPNGVSAARSAGMRVIAIPALDHDHDFPDAPTHIFANLHEARTWLVSEFSQSQNLSLGRAAGV